MFCIKEAEPQEFYCSYETPEKCLNITHYIIILIPEDDHLNTCYSELFVFSVLFSLIHSNIKTEEKQLSL